MAGGKSLVFYTDYSSNRKRLNFGTDIVLTLAPVDSDGLPKGANELAWKVLRFDPSFPTTHTVIWHPEAGFSVVNQNEDGTLSNRTQTQIVELKHMTSLDVAGSSTFWSEPIKNQDIPTVVAYNNCNIPKQLALCSVDNSQPSLIFSPVYSLGILPHGEQVECRHPMMLQAYAVTGYKESQLFKSSDKKHFLLKDHKNDPKPLNMDDAQQFTGFQLYSHTSGRPVVEKV
ncbi:hypothetical protein C8R46DRAFT_1065677 [Mycena filopes]|nr:hypothetical protein C8R46DRAFT_1065677 [Mycena filopes]